MTDSPRADLPARAIRASSRAWAARWGAAFGLLLAACGTPRPTAVEDVGSVDFEGGLGWSSDGPTNTGAFGDARGMATPAAYPDADFSVELPYMGPEQTRLVTVDARAGRVDVHLMIDTTGSFDGEIDDIQSQLSNTIVPSLRARIPSLTLGVSRFEDMPFSPFGADSDRPFTLLVPQTTNVTRVLSAVQRLDMPIGNGGDGPESWIEALYQAATGEGLRSRGNLQLVSAWRNPGGDSGPLGGVGWRESSTRLIVLVTDARSHEGEEYSASVPTAHSSQQAITALRDRNIRVLGIASGDSARDQLERFAIETRATAPPEADSCPTGVGTIRRSPVGGQCPQVYDISPTGQGLSRTIVDSIARLLDAAVYREAWGETRDDEPQFVRALEAIDAVIPAGSGSSQPRREDLRPSGHHDGFDDTYLDVSARLSLRFRIHLANRTVPSLEWPQTFLLRVVLIGDGEVLREVTIRVTVPEGPKSDVPGTDATIDAPSVISEAGLDARGDGALDATASLDATGSGGADAGAVSDVPGMPDAQVEGASSDGQVTVDESSPATADAASLVDAQAGDPSAPDEGDASTDD